MNDKWVHELVHDTNRKEHEPFIVHNPDYSCTSSCIKREKFMNHLVRALPFVVHGLLMKSVHELVLDTKLMLYLTYCKIWRLY